MSGIAFFKKGLSKKQELFPRHSLSWRITLAAVDTIISLYPDEARMLLFFKVARRANYITNEDIDSIMTQLKISLANQPKDLAGIVTIIKKSQESLQVYVNKPRKCKSRQTFKSSKDELQWLRKDHARLLAIVNDVQACLKGHD